MFRVVLLGFLVFGISMVFVPAPIYAISLDDEEEDAEDVADLLEEAKKAASSESFGRANELLKKAKMYGVSGSEVKETGAYIAKKQRQREERLERERRERERLARLKREREERARRARVSSSRSVYITSWGVDFSGDDRLWGRHGVKLSNGQEIYTWLSRQSYGSRCYELFVQGAFLGGGSNCSNSINNSWSASCGSGQFWVQGDQADVVRAIVKRCAR